MVSFILGFSTVVLFCLSCHFFIRSLVTPLPAINMTQYSRAALKLQKSYQVISWGVMLVIFLVGMVYSYYDIYTQF